MYLNYCFLYLSLDIDECFVDNSLCGETGDCVNTDGGYLCSCLQGYQPGQGGKICLGNKLPILYYVFIGLKVDFLLCINCDCLQYLIQ